MADLPRSLVVWRRVLVAVIAAMVAAFALWACSANGGFGGGPDGSGDFDTGLTMYEAAERPDAPDIEGETLDGDQLALADLEGKVVVVNVWGSWCAPCREEAPDLAKVSRETYDQGVRFVGIDVRDNRAAARAFADDYDIPYPSWYDQPGQLVLAFDQIIPVGAVPSTVVIDPQGRIAARVIGKTDYPTLQGLVDDILAEQPRSQRPG
jgi:peroxiredoxin